MAPKSHMLNINNTCFSFGKMAEARPRGEMAEARPRGEMAEARPRGEAGRKKKQYY